MVIAFRFSVAPLQQTKIILSSMKSIRASQNHKSNQKIKCSANKNYTLASKRKTLLQTTKKKAVVFALFFEGATHLRSNWPLITDHWTLSGTLKNQTVQQEFQILGLDKKRCYWFQFFYPAPKFETLARRPQLRNNKIRLRKKFILTLKKAVVFALFFEGATHLRSNWPLITDHWTLTGTLKNQNCSKSFKFRFWIKSVAIDFGFFIQPQNLKPLQDDPNSERKKSDFHWKILLRNQKIKNKKKVAKLSSGFTKKQVQALRVF